MILRHQLWQSPCLAFWLAPAAFYCAPLRGNAWDKRAEGRGSGRNSNDGMLRVSILVYL